MRHKATHSDSKDDALSPHYFIAFYVSMAGMWLLYSLPGIFVDNLQIITFSQIVGNAFIYVTAIIVMQIIFISINKRYLGIISSITIAVLGLAYIFGERLYASLYTPDIAPPYIYWHPNSPSWLPLMTGITAIIGTLIFIITFFVYGLQSRPNAAVYSKAFHLSAGMTFLLSASIFYFIFANSGGLVMTSTASLLGILGLLIMLRGIKY